MRPQGGFYNKAPRLRPGVGSRVEVERSPVEAGGRAVVGRGGDGAVGTRDRGQSVGLGWARAELARDEGDPLEGEAVSLGLPTHAGEVEGLVGEHVERPATCSESAEPVPFSAKSESTEQVLSFSSVKSAGRPWTSK
jgi:hypothetical protein